MQRALATFREGRIEFDSGVDWPEGTRVEILPIENAVGMRDADWPATSEGVTALLKRMKEREPLEMTDAEYAVWEGELRSERQRQKEFTRQSWAQVETLH